MSIQRLNDPDLAVQREFEHLAAQGTAEAYKLFISRHPGHRLAEEARKRLKELEKESKEP